MGEKALRNTFIFGSVFFFIILAGMTINSVRQVTATRTVGLSDSVVSGKNMWRSKNCNDCHTILGIGGYFAPELTKVGDRRDAAWLTDWLHDPQSVEAGVSMPNQHLDAAQIESLIAFFQWVREIDTNDWPPQSATTAASSNTTPAEQPKTQ